MIQSPTIGAIATALAKAQATYKPAIKDAANPFFKSKYVALDGAIDACREALTSNGIAVVQATGYDGDKLILNTMLIHSSGEFIGGTYPIKAIKEDPQGIGSAVTYARRYSLMALVGLAAEDDDGNAASGNPSAPAKVASKTGEAATKKPTWTADQTKEVGSIFAEVYAIGGTTGEADVAKLRKDMAYDAPSDVIDAAAKILHKWRDIAMQNESGA